MEGLDLGSSIQLCACKIRVETCSWRGQHEVLFIENEKYLSNHSLFFKHIPPAGASAVCRGILSAREALLQGACSKLGKWLDDPALE